MIRIVFYSKLLAERSNIEHNVQGLKKVLPILSEVIIVSENIRSALLREMKEGSFANQKRLPRETVLSEQLGISRTQLRDELASLEREGFITRRHGVGTVINHHVFAVKNRMEQEQLCLQSDYLFTQQQLIIWLEEVEALIMDHGKTG